MYKSYATNHDGDILWFNHPPFRGNSRDMNMFPKILGTPKSSIFIQFSIINHPFWVPPFMDNPLWLIMTNLTSYESENGGLNQWHRHFFWVPDVYCFRAGSAIFRQTNLLSIRKPWWWWIIGIFHTQMQNRIMSHSDRLFYFQSLLEFRWIFQM